MILHSEQKNSEQMIMDQISRLEEELELMKKKQASTVNINIQKSRKSNPYIVNSRK